jgi:hypothetical protein
LSLTRFTFIIGAIDEDLGEELTSDPEVEITEV